MRILFRRNWGFWKGIKIELWFPRLNWSLVVEFAKGDKLEYAPISFRRRWINIYGFCFGCRTERMPF